MLELRNDSNSPKGTYGTGNNTSLWMLIRWFLFLNYFCLLWINERKQGCLVNSCFGPLQTFKMTRCQCEFNKPALPVFWSVPSWGSTGIRTQCCYLWLQILIPSRYLDKPSSSLWAAWLLRQTLAAHPAIPLSRLRAPQRAELTDTHCDGKHGLLNSKPKCQHSRPMYISYRLYHYFTYLKDKRLLLHIDFREKELPAGL